MSRRIWLGWIEGGAVVSALRQNIIFTRLKTCGITYYSKSATLVPHVFNQWSKVFKILCFSNYKDSAEKVISKRVQLTNGAK